MLLLPASLLGAATDLRVVQAGPMGEIAKLEEAKRYGSSFRADGRARPIPETVTAPFIRIRPDTGRFRWSGTHTLIFSPPILPSCLTPRAST